MFMVTSRIASPDYPITYKGEPRGESAITVEDEIGPAINHTFSVCYVLPQCAGSLHADSSLLTQDTK